MLSDRENIHFCNLTLDVVNFVTTRTGLTRYAVDAHHIGRLLQRTSGTVTERKLKGVRINKI